LVFSLFLQILKPKISKVKTILITGINGFLGSHLAKLLSTKYNIVGLELSKSDLFRLKDYDFEVYETDEQSINGLFSNHQIDIIIHTATLYGRSDTKKADLIENNVLFPVKLIEKAIQHQVKAFINTDSFFNTGELNYAYLSEYTLTKKQVIEWLKVFTDKIKVVNMKLFHIFGQGDSPTKFITKLIADLQTETIIKLTAGEQVRDFIYVDNVTSAYEMICNKIGDFTFSYYNFEVGMGEGITLKKFVETAAKLSNSQTKLDFGALPYREGEIMTSIADNSKLKHLGWKPEVGVEEGIAKIIQFKY